MKFDTSEAAKLFIESVHPRVGARNQAILGRSALFLAIGEGVPGNFKIKDSKGVTLNDEQVVGDDLKDVVRAALNKRLGQMLDDSAYRQAFRLHFEYGCTRLIELWEESGNDQTKFIAALLKLQSGLAGVVNGFGSVPAMPVVESEVKLKLLDDGPEWSMNGPGTKNGLLVISGGSGSGKSQLALGLLAQLATHGVRFIFFDLKGELEEDPSNEQQQKNRQRFLELTKAKYVRLIEQGLPVNPLVRGDSNRSNAQVAHEVASLIRAFASQLGAKQARLIADAYQSLPIPDFAQLLQELERRGADGVEHAIIKKIVDFGLFAQAQKAITPEEWLSTSLVIDFKAIGTDDETKALAVALLLNFLMKKLNRNQAIKDGIQPLKMVLFVDEAHLLLPKEGKAGLLGSLARQGRSWGFPIWLASQDADAFVTSGTHATNFAELAECGVHFSPETLSVQEQKKIIGGMLSRKLSKGEAVVRMPGQTEVGTAIQFWKQR